MMLHLMIPLDRVTREALAEPANSMVATHAIADSARAAYYGRSLDGQRRGRVLEIDPPFYYTPYRELVEQVKAYAAVAARERAEREDDQFDADDLIEIADDVAESWIPALDYHRLILFAEAPDMADDCECPYPAEYSGDTWAGIADQLGNVIHCHLRRIAGDAAGDKIAQLESEAAHA